jgi:ubiquinone/menaquinone biosynthesis C-methylase UbiE
VYEVENRAIDPDRQVEAAMRSIRDWRGGQVLDIGCGTGFHLPRFAADAAGVVGVEPHPALVELARRRTARLGTVEVRTGTAQRLPVADASVDVAHARWAYFFGPGCEPGLRELSRVMRRGGAAFVVDTDASRSTFGAWFRRELPRYDPDAVERFWARQGWSRTPVMIRLTCRSRPEFEAVVRIEFSAAVAAGILAEHRGTEVDYAVNLFWRTF